MRAIAPIWAVGYDSHCDCPVASAPRRPPPSPSAPRPPRLVSNAIAWKARCTYTGGLGALGAPQLEWLAKDLNGKPASTPIVVFAHMPLWTIHQAWGWGTADAEAALSLLRRFGSVTILNGHIHQIVQKVEGNITFHTARSTAYPQPAPGVGPGPGPLKVAADQLHAMLGTTEGRVMKHPSAVALADSTLA